MTVSVYYNEIDPFACKWLRYCMEKGFIPEGVIDQRSIEDVSYEELRQYRQCHLFAGIGGWAYALRLAGIPDTEPVWTGSCPCQPFSAAGAKGATRDSRHLWPAFYSLIQHCRPQCVFGEQVASQLGRAWFSDLQADLESVGYSVGATDLCAASVGAPHIRSRLYWMAYSNMPGLEGCFQSRQFVQSAAESPAGSSGLAQWLADPGLYNLHGQAEPTQDTQQKSNRPSSVSGLQCRPLADGKPLPGFWSGADWIGCRDDAWRPVEPGTHPLVDGLPNRVQLLHGYGNAIVPQLAAVFLQSGFQAIAKVKSHS